MRHCTGETPISEEIPSEEMLPTGVEWDRMVCVGDGFVFDVKGKENQPILGGKQLEPMKKSLKQATVDLGGGLNTFFYVHPYLRR